MRIELRPDGPHSDDYTTEVARGLAEAVRVLNYATGSHASGGLTCPQTVYEVSGNLAGAADRLRQLLNQLAAFLDHQAAAGRLADDSGADPALIVGSARRHLGHAMGSAAALANQMSLVQNTVSGLYPASADDHEEGDRS